MRPTEDQKGSSHFSHMQFAPSLCQKKIKSVSIKGPEQLNDEGPLEVFQKRIKAKDRRRVTERTLKIVQSADDEEETDCFTDEHELCNEVEIKRFVL